MGGVRCSSTLRNCTRHTCFDVRNASPTLTVLHYMGDIIYWGLLRFVLVVAAAWAFYSYAPNYGEWWSMFFVAVGVIVIYPAQLSYRKHQDEVKRSSLNGLCVTCRHYVPDNTLCSVTDEHVRRDYTPCDGVAWEPIQISSYPN